jgi:hypothetical protein
MKKIESIGHVNTHKSLIDLNPYERLLESQRVFCFFEFVLCNEKFDKYRVVIFEFLNQ